MSDGRGGRPSSIAGAARKYGAAAAISLRNRLAYAWNFVGSVLAYGLFVFVFSRVWTAAYAGRAEIAGYDRAMSIWYFIAAEIPAFGFGRFFWSLAEEMKSGQVAYRLARPYSFVGYHYAERMGAALADLAIYLALGLALGWIIVGPPPIASAAQGAALLVSILLAGSVQFFLQFSIAMTAFWIEENQAFFWIFQKFTLVIGTLLPLEFLPLAVQRVAWWTPFPSLAYAPARILVAWSPEGGAWLLAFQAAWVILSLALCRAVFGLGSSRISIQGG
jgi:ABC-2 type transport system permease protein